MLRERVECLLQEAPPARRIGIKGRAATNLLARHGLALPERPNSWTTCTLPGAPPGSPSARLLRLGFAEYLLDCDAPLMGADPLAFVVDPPPACYLVLRDDRAFLLAGDDCEALLAEVCNIDFATLEPATRTVVLTLMAGVAVIVVRETTRTPLYRIWCDPSLGHYLWSTLRRVVIEGGGQVEPHILESTEVLT